MQKLKSARHHWWPQCVSSHWAADDGTVGWLKPDGTCLRLPPKQLGVINSGHHIKLGHREGVVTSWDTSFESEFDRADTNFPLIISWLEALNHDLPTAEQVAGRFIPHSATDEQLRLLTECVVSLAVRGPMNREASVSLAEDYRGPIPGPERNALIGMNMRQSQRLIADCIGARGKYVVLLSQSKEFIFGDGFFHNVKAVVNPPLAPKLLVPITPSLSVAITRPNCFTVHPRLCTIVLTDSEVDACNHAVQVYSREALYFRSEVPKTCDAYMCAQHKEYSHPDNPIDTFFRGIPGVPPRDGSLDGVLSWLSDEHQP